jgi:hypothetical protein
VHDTRHVVASGKDCTRDFPASPLSTWHPQALRVTDFQAVQKMSSYYDVDAILTDAQKVPCTFELTVPGLGFLEGNMSGDMKQGSKVELPLWLGEMLALR